MTSGIAVKDRVLALEVLWAGVKVELAEALESPIPSMCTASTPAIAPEDVSGVELIWTTFQPINARVVAKTAAGRAKVVMNGTAFIMTS